MAAGEALGTHFFFRFFFAFRFDMMVVELAAALLAWRIVLFQG